jgi:hypothetical protein
MMDDYDIWANARAEEQWADYQRWLVEERAHRCPMDMPPCPACQEREAALDAVLEP